MQPRKPDRIPSVAAVMTPFPWFIHIEDRLARAIEVMEEHQIRHLPVTDAGRLTGVVTQRDIRLIEGATPVAQRERLTVRDACVLDAYIVDVGERLDRVLLEMAARHIGSALVVKHDKLAGIFTATDACRAFGEYLGRQHPEPGDDEAA